MPIKEMLDGLDEEQRKAVTLESNGVVAAGAGSGKTRVLASRYAWLVTEKNFKPEEILTLTFTNKAVSEMYSRIYRYLSELAAPESGGLEAPGDGRAMAALKDFHKARISTLDSFSAGVARSAAARYGISPDFVSDDAALRELAGNEALVFVLDHREDAAIRALLVDHKIRALAEEIFAAAALNYGPISNPPPLDEQLALQKRMLLESWRENSTRLLEISRKMIDELSALAAEKGIAFTKALGDILLASPPPLPPDIAPFLETDFQAGGGNSSHADIDAGQAVYLSAQSAREKIKKYFDYYSALNAVRTPSNYRREVYEPLVSLFKELKGPGALFTRLKSIANSALNFELCGGVFRLVGEFLGAFNEKKRASGLLSFSDIARLALDALRDHPDIRKVYKDSLKAIMIDEFQDNNALQRDLVYLLAEKSGRMEKSVPPPEELEENRMFFVGDEKQSIYRFRGADVAVFRSLSGSLSKKTFERGAEGAVDLLHNYRSSPALISAFNRIFAEVFLPEEHELPDYEALYKAAKAPDLPAGENSNPQAEAPASFCFLNGGDLSKDDPGGIKSHDLEAAFIAEKIRRMVENGVKIPKREGGETLMSPCAWGDFAVLERSYTHQGTLEKYFREFGIPYNTDRPAGLFNEAPVLDLRAYLRLLVYPEDRVAYATLIRSPFTRLGDLTLAVCMLDISSSDKGTPGTEASGTDTPPLYAEPFSERNDPFIPEEDRELYCRARKRYRALRELSRKLPVTELITRIWFEEGYRFETLWSESAQVYESLFDLFFSLASESDRRGKSLAEFIEYLDKVMAREEKPDDRDIPGEGEAGVRIMSIHKSKGLEFPIVFLYNCAGAGNSGLSGSMLHYHERYGLVPDIPEAEEVPEGGNYFRELLAEEEKAKDHAELRRLLYVAMTRAESRLFLTFTLPKQNSAEKKEWDMTDGPFNEEALIRRLSQLEEKDGERETFLTLLAGALLDCPRELCALETIPILSRGEISVAAARSAASLKALPRGEEKPSRALGMREAALAAEAFYERAEILPPGKAGPLSLNASKLRPKSADISPVEETRDSGKFDALLERSGLSPADFGVLIHAALESRLSGRPCLVPPGIASRFEEGGVPEELLRAAGEMAGAFLATDLGKRWAASGYRESEFPVITSADVHTGGKERRIPVMGRIDLLFEEDREVVVADFKTGRIERDEEHYGQLAAYYRAAGDIFGKPVSLWLCYLRSGKNVNVTEEVSSLSLDEMAEEALAGDGV